MMNIEIFLSLIYLFQLVLNLQELSLLILVLTWCGDLEVFVLYEKLSRISELAKLLACSLQRVQVENSSSSMISEIIGLLI